MRRDVLVVASKQKRLLHCELVSSFLAGACIFVRTRRFALLQGQASCVASKSFQVEDLLSCLNVLGKNWSRGCGQHRSKNHRNVQYDREVDDSRGPFRYMTKSKPVMAPKRRNVGSLSSPRHQSGHHVDRVAGGVSAVVS